MYLYFTETPHILKIKIDINLEIIFFKFYWLYFCLHIDFHFKNLYKLTRFYLLRYKNNYSFTSVIIRIIYIMTEVFPCFFLSCKANARVNLAKAGHGPHSPHIVVLFYVLFVLCRSVYYLCVNVYCTTATG